jgi:hypothetical protein
MVIHQTGRGCRYGTGPVFYYNLLIVKRFVKSSAAAYAFYLAMTLYPRVMKIAQQELDSVVGTGKLPTFADRPSLPYLEALFTETLRWHSPAPISKFGSPIQRHWSLTEVI